MQKYLLHDDFRLNLLKEAAGMDNNAKEQFLKKLHNEQQLFRRSMIQMGKEEIYGEAYRIEITAVLYDILIEKAELFSENILEKLAGRENVLQFLYNTWLKKEDNLYEELCSHVEYETGLAAERG